MSFQLGLISAAVAMLLFTASSGAAGTAHPTDSCPTSAGLTKGSVADHGSKIAAGKVLSIEAGDSYFEPTCQTGVLRGSVTLRVKNNGRVLHNISVAEQGIDQDIAPGESARVKLEIGKGSLRFLCKYHSAAGMVGALVSR